MSKTLKRIFSAALVLCMLLAVLPATASAEDATNSTVYNFVWTDTAAEGYTANKGMVPYKVYDYANKDTVTNNWYFLNSSDHSTGTNSDTFLNSGGIGTNQGFNGQYGYSKFIYLVINVPEAGYYDIGAVHAMTTKGRLRLNFTKPADGDITTVESWTSTNGMLADPLVSNDSSFDKVIDFNLKGTNSSNASLAILGNQYFEAGEYLLFIDAYDCVDKTTYKDCRNTIRKLVLTPSVQEGKIIDYAINNEVTNGIISVQTDSWDASKGDIALKRRTGFTGITTFDLRGNEAKFNSLSSAPGITVQDSKSGGALTMAGGLAPVLRSNYQYQLPLSADGASFKLADATVALASEIQEAKDAEGNAVEADGAFVFAVNMADIAYEYGTNGLEVTMVIKDTTTEESYEVVFAGDEMQGTALNDWSKDTKYFYVNIKGLDAVAGHSLQVTANVSCGGMSVSGTQTYAIPAAA